MMKVVPVRFDHIKQLERLEGLFFTGVKDEVNVRAILERTHGYAIIRESDEKVMAAGGIISQWPGVGLLWLMVSEDMKLHHVRMLVTVCADVLEKIRTKGKFHRFQVFIDPDQSRHIRFIEALGFTFEGRMVKHTTDQHDHLLYARTY